MIAELKRPNQRSRITRILIRYRTSLPHLLLEKQIRIAVRSTGIHPLRVVGKIDCAVFDFECLVGFVVLFEEHTGLPAGTAGEVGAAGALAGLELVAVVGVLHKELHVFGNVDVDDQGDLFVDVVVQFVEVVDGVAHLGQALLQGDPSAEVQFT